MRCSLTSGKWFLAAAFAVLTTLCSVGRGQAPAGGATSRPAGGSPAPRPAPRPPQPQTIPADAAVITVNGPQPHITEFYAYRRQIGGVPVKFVKDRTKDYLEIAKDLSQGRIDFAILLGPIYDPKKPGSKVDLLREMLKAANCAFGEFGWNAKALLVHPSRKLNEIDEATALKIIKREIKNWKELGETEGQIFLDTAEIPRSVAANPDGIAYTDVIDPVIDSGLKILAIRPTGGGEALLPTAENVGSLRYPFYRYWVMADRPGAPQIVRQFHADAMKDITPIRVLMRWPAWWGSPEWTFPGIVKASVSPLPDNRPPPETSATVVLSAAACANDAFLLTDKTHYAAYDQAIFDGVSQYKGLKVVDRAQLDRVFFERRLALLNGEPSKGPILAADVLVTAFLVRDQHCAVLEIQAIHAPSAFLLGQIRLPVDPAAPATFSPSLKDRIGQWWPGVLRNLQTLRVRPTWDILPCRVADLRVNERVQQVRASVAESLAKDERGFTAEHKRFGDAQRELVMVTAGLARPEGEIFTPASDYIVRLRPDGNRLVVQILRGADLLAVEQTVAEDWNAASICSWVKERSAKLTKPSPAQVAAESRPSEAVTQARLAMEEAAFLIQERSKLAAEIRAAGPTEHDSPGNIEHMKQLGENMVELGRDLAACYARAAQLDPANEEAVYQNTDVRWRFDSGGPLSAARLVRHYLDSFPRGSHRGNMMQRYITMQEALGQSMAKKEAKGFEGIEQGLLEKRSRECQREALRWLAEYMKAYLPEGRTVGDQGILVYTGRYARSLQAYLGRPDVKPEEAEEVIREYAQWTEKYPAQARPADFFRLDYLFLRRDKEGCLALLSAMQKQWPDPKDVHWHGREDFLYKQLGDLFEKRPVELKFKDWMQGRGEIGTLP